ncbi:hypothetical protein B0T26DRAFT_757663 [Lasiosphaeria miniovina]|uniref:Uncharacterized protein n=1 Tax=Lasiosphaeria miniovina TaxID=1954250 RepID=A0AA39ZQD7_9PEZI|nr:uncharacterized protein B0T26DRAFT_757663 [Lasiosphaeria miniovina]KAK0701664.1 hypothetical protein B0T26DRAFT_757663 [Lasiosphaeria miniovina]
MAPAEPPPWKYSGMRYYPLSAFVKRRHSPPKRGHIEEVDEFTTFGDGTTGYSHPPHIQPSKFFGHQGNEFDMAEPERSEQQLLEGMEPDSFHRLISQKFVADEIAEADFVTDSDTMVQLFNVAMDCHLIDFKAPRPLFVLAEVIQGKIFLKEVVRFGAEPVAGQKAMAAFAARAFDLCPSLIQTGACVWDHRRVSSFLFGGLRRRFPKSGSDKQLKKLRFKILVQNHTTYVTESFCSPSSCDSATGTSNVAYVIPVSNQEEEDHADMATWLGLENKREALEFMKSAPKMYFSGAHQFAFLRYGTVSPDNPDRGWFNTNPRPAADKHNTRSMLTRWKNHCVGLGTVPVILDAIQREARRRFLDQSSPEFGKTTMMAIRFPEFIHDYDEPCISFGNVYPLDFLAEEKYDRSTLIQAPKIVSEEDVDKHRIYFPRKFPLYYTDEEGKLCTMDPDASCEGDEFPIRDGPIKPDPIKPGAWFSKRLPAHPPEGFQPGFSEGYETGLAEGYETGIKDETAQVEKAALGETTPDTETTPNTETALNTERAPEDKMTPKAYTALEDGKIAESDSGDHNVVSAQDRDNISRGKKRKLLIDEDVTCRKHWQRGISRGRDGP